VSFYVKFDIVVTIVIEVFVCASIIILNPWTHKTNMTLVCQARGLHHYLKSQGLSGSDIDDL